ncbi:LLM class flavin-dependent oxidoreductase [Streptomyces zhihengii]
MAAANAVMDELIARGPQFQAAMNERGDRLRARIDAVLNEAGTGVRVIGRGTAFRFVRADSTSFAFIGSDFHQFRRNLIAEGVYITETGLSYVSDAHTDEVLDEIVAAVERAVRPRPSRTARPAETSSPQAATVPATGREAAGPAVAGAAVSDAAGSDSAAREVAAARPLAVSLAFFGMQDSAHGGNFYDTVTGLAEAAEAGGLDALWFPERHFDRFAGFSPNPAVLAALVAARTHRIALRAGSAVLPLHPPVTVAEDWAMLDVASGDGSASPSPPAGCGATSSCPTRPTRRGATSSNSASRRSPGCGRGEGPAGEPRRDRRGSGAVPQARPAGTASVAGGAR